MPHRIPSADAAAMPPALWQATFDEAPTPMLLVAACGRIRAVNRALQGMFRLSDPFVDACVLNYDLLADPAVSRLQLRSLLADALHGRNHQNHIVRYDPALHRRSGSVQHMHVYLTPLAQGAAPTQQVLITLVDITPHVEADARMQAKERQLRAVVDHAPALIFLKSIDHRFILANKAISEVFHKEIEGRYDWELFPRAEAETLHAWDRKIMEAGVAETFEETLTNPSGPRRFLTVKFPLRDDTNQVIGIGGISQDITERVRAEEENARLQISERSAREADKVKSEFLATMSHEIRTPLAGIIGLARIVMDATRDAEARKHLKNLDAAAHMLLHILNDVLDLSKLEAKKLVFDTRSFDLYSLVDSTCQTLAAFASGKGLQLAWHVQQNLPRYIVSDGGRIAQVLNNLVNNAIKFSERGTIKVDIAPAAAVPEDGEFAVTFTVADEGIGISQESLAKLFTPFSQADGTISRRFGGTGLGLTICRAIIEGLGGRIEVATVVDEGSKFSFTIPVKVARARVPEKEESVAAACGLLEGRVLVVEDNPVNQTIVLHQLAKLGLEADVAPDGKVALERIREHYYSVVLMDCHMPTMDGFEATKRIRAFEDVERSTVPIVALTANALAGERERCLAAGMTDYLSKPVNTQLLYNCLTKFLRPQS